MLRQIRPIFLVSILFLLLLPVVGVSTVRAQDLPGISDLGVEYIFGEQITFRAQVASIADVKQAWVTYSLQGETSSHIEPMDIDPTGELRCTVVIDLERLNPFSTVNYHFSIGLLNGGTIESPAFSFDYMDNRFDWEALESGGFLVHWYQGDRVLAQSVADIAQESLQHASTLMAFADPGTVDIYVYASSDEMIQALPSNGYERVVGHASPALSLVVVALPAGPDQRLLAEQRIPHEIMHILLYRQTGNRAGSLPAWLNEGLASINELYPDPDYQILLENAYQEDRLLPIDQLCQSFPSATNGVGLAYAQSASFTRYLHRTYGSAALETLVSGYADGLSCERGVEVAYERTLAVLERDWKSAVFAGVEFEKPDHLNLLPWIAIVAAAVAVPLISALTSLRKPTPREKTTHG